jgi:hypothetical protein
MKQKHIYLSGPMTGIPDDNAGAFFKAEAYYMEKGCQVTNPYRLGVRYAQKHEYDSVNDVNYHKLLANDLMHMVGCTEVAVLPGWEQSEGVRMELIWAEKLGLPVYYAYSNSRVKYKTGFRIENLVVTHPEELTELEKVLLK